jgi:hypothetical protein
MSDPFIVGLLWISAAFEEKSEILFVLDKIEEASCWTWTEKESRTKVWNILIIELKTLQ